jgi:tRNA threonylcarbamoyladenosine biosynthesis protein TsaE
MEVECSKLLLQTMSQEPANTIVASNLEEMQTAAETFLSAFPQGAHVAVYGEMGAGKTTFIQCICHAFGLQFAGSPTFSLVNEYTLSDGKKLYHFDLYRLNSAEELRAIGFEEYLDAGHYIFIEWPQIAAGYTNEMKRLTITDNLGIRSIEF